MVPQGCDQGPEARTFLGVMYAQGQGVRSTTPRPRTGSVRPPIGLQPAQSNLGLMYAQGRGVAQNDAEAAKWSRKAAEQGPCRSAAPFSA